jgi:hypothetical protein
MSERGFITAAACLPETIRKYPAVSSECERVCPQRFILHNSWGICTAQLLLLLAKTAVDFPCESHRNLVVDYVSI